jgi:proline iminopeptidase
MTTHLNADTPVNEKDVEQGHVPFTGGKTWYKIVGKHTKGIPVLILHGGPGASHDYLEPLAELAKERPVVFYDQLGCGNSDNPDDPSLWTINSYVEQLHQVRETLGLEKVHFIGQSWGTSLAVDYVLSRGDDGVASLVLSGPLLSSKRWIEDQKVYIQALPDEIRHIIQKSEETGDFSSPQYQDAMMAFYNRHVCRLDPWPECLTRAFEKLNFPLYQHMWGPSEFTVTGVLGTYERVDRLKEISIPALFTCGAFDEATPATTRYYQTHLPGSRIHVFEDASHEHHLEKPEKYLQVVQDFLCRAEKQR